MRAREQLKKQFGQRVRAARLAAGYSQRQLAERADITDKYLSRLESGLVVPSVVIATRIAVSVGVGLETLTGTAKTKRDPRFEALVTRLSALPATEVERAIRVLRALLDG